MVVKIGVSFWAPIFIRHLLFRVPKKGTVILTTTHIGASNNKRPENGCDDGNRNDSNDRSMKPKPETLNPKP